MNVQHTSTREIEEALDRGALDKIRQRFLRLNSQRLTRVHEALRERQHLFLDVLPLLLHINHPLLPGFVSHQTPAGLSGFTLTPAHIRQGRQLARSLNLSAQKTTQREIWGIFLMGSLGTIAHTPSSDFDIWLCYDPQLPPAALLELEHKVAKISHWAAGLGLEAHFFLLTDTAFREGKMLPMSRESSGSAQHLLLLDEFYRTSIWLGGRTPLWWLVPPAIEAAGRYQAHVQALTRQGCLAAEDYLDFGSCAQVAAGEFVGAGLWQLYKAIESPYKSVLKLFLLEVYAKQIETFNALSSQFKHAVYQGNNDLDVLDPYIAAYEFVADHLKANGDTERLRLLRRSLYFKVNKLLSKPATGRVKSWQRERMEVLIKHWGWQSRDLMHLDARKQWKCAEVLQERDELVISLARSFREMESFVKQYAANIALDGMDFVLLRNKLAAAFAVRPGKIMAINPGISRDISAAVLQVTLSVDHWLLSDEQGNPLYQHPRLCAALLWALFNRIIEPTTKLVPRLGLAPKPVVRARQVITQWLAAQSLHSEHTAFAQPGQVTSVLLMVNWPAGDHQPSQHHLRQLSDKCDPFNYGINGENRVLCVDAVYRNAWGEIFHREFSGTDAVFTLLKWYWQITTEQDKSLAPALTIDVYDTQQATTMAQRLRQWLNGVINNFRREDGPNRRYLFALGNQLYCLYRRHNELIPLTIYNEADLWNFLSAAQPNFRPLVIDPYCLQGHILPALLPHVQPQTVSVFYQVLDTGLLIIVVDERGSILRTTLDRAPKLRSLLNLLEFIRNALVELSRLQQPVVGAFGVVPLAFFEMQKTGDTWVVSRKQLAVEHLKTPPISVKVLVQDMGESGCEYRFFCEGQAFIPRENQDALTDLAQWLLHKRALRELYPLFINELVFMQPKAQVQLIDYLKAKRSVEAMLNRALTELLGARR